MGRNHQAAHGADSGLHAKNDVHDTLHFTEPLRDQVVGHLDIFVVPPGDLEGEAYGGELNQPHTKVASVGIVIVGLDVADTAVIVFRLTLNKKIGLIGLRQIKIIFASGLAIEREVLAAGLSDRYVVGVESQCCGPSSARSILPRLRLPEVPAGLGRAEPTRLCPDTSDIDLLGYGEGIVNLGLCSNQLAFVQATRLGAAGIGLSSFCMIVLLGY
jgi:hypothetical protein